MGKLKILPREERICKICSSNHIEDEIHFMFVCTGYKQLRDKYLEDLFNTYHNLSLLDFNNLFIWTMSNEDDIFIKRLSDYIFSLFKLRKELSNASQ